MAKLKKTSRAKPSASKTSAAELQERAEHLSRSLVESAQQIWMAGVGAFTRAQGEGSKLFEALVNEGMNIEQTTRKLATGKVELVRDAMEDRVGVVRGRASDTWDRLEKVFEDRVQRALNRLGIPGREELAELIARVDDLTAQVKKSGTGAARTSSPTARKSARGAASTASKSPRKGARKPAAKSPAKTASAPRKSSRKSLPKASRPNAPQA